MADFVHLHVHSHYSLLDGVPKIPELIAAVKERSMSAVALTDHGNLYGAIEFYQAATEANIKPIIGVEMYLAPQTIADQIPKERPFHIVLLAENFTGYKNLIKLVTQSNLQGFYYKPRIDFDLLRQHSEGLIALSGCLSGQIARTLLQDGVDKAAEVVQHYLEIFDRDHFYLEVQYNPNTPEQTIVNTGIKELHNRLHVQMVATNDVHYIEPEDAEAQDVLVCIQTKATLDQPNRFSMRSEDYSLTTAEVMAERFIDFPNAVSNTTVIANRINVEIPLYELQTPEFHLPPNQTEDSYLRQLCETGLSKRYSVVDDTIKQRLEYELEVIGKTGFSAYFLIVQDFINWAKNEGIAVGPGRGSAAGSIVAYLTGITDIDPIAYDLLFERFLNPERVSQPDVDTDFADIRRDDVLRYVEQTYGKDHVAQIITFGTMAARAAVRDVGRALGLPYGFCDRIAKLIPMFTNLEDALTEVPELATLINDDADAERVIRLAQKLEGVVRHTSTHACAVVITKHPLTTHVPLQQDQDGAIITQYSMHPIDALGLLKMDFLGLKNLTIIETTLEIIAATTDQQVNIEQIPLDDKTTFQLLQQANTVGVFQLESSGMRRYLKQLKPTEFEDIIAMVSLYRPGPMEFIPDYIEGKQGKRTITYIDERLRPILEKTYGIAVYQEQVLEIARQLAGFSYGEADILRKAVGKKIKSLLDEQSYKMIDGMVKNGINSSIAQQIWDFILPFARYGFNRSHAACYAMIAYRTAYLKANYPSQFMAALMTADADNSDRIAIEIQHARDLGFEVLPPDINESFDTFAVVKETLTDAQPRIRFGLSAIKNVGNHLIEVLLDKRKVDGKFTSLENFLQRVADKDMNKKSLESLIKVGALDEFGERQLLLENIDTLLAYARQQQLEKQTGQGNLFGGHTDVHIPTLHLTDTTPADNLSRAQWEKELLGIYLTDHPLQPYRNRLQRLGMTIAAIKDPETSKAAVVSVIGIIGALKRLTTKTGEQMLFLTLTDETGEIEAMLFPRAFAEHGGYWQMQDTVLVTGKKDTGDGVSKLIINTIAHVTPQTIQCIDVRVPGQMPKSQFDLITQVLQDHPGDAHVFLVTDENIISTQRQCSLTVIPALEKIIGQGCCTMVE